MKPVVLLLGEEPFLQREALAALLERHPELETTRFAGDQTPCGRVLDEVRTRTLLGGGRAVVVERAGPLLEGDALRALVGYARNPVPGSMLVLSAPKLDGRLKGSKDLRSAAEVIECAPIEDWKVKSWLVGHASRRHGLRLDPDAAEELKDRVGEDLGFLDAALARLRELISPRTRLSAEDVAGSTEDQRSPVLFEASNALEAGDLPKALGALRAAFDEGVRVRQNIVTDESGIAHILLGQLHSAYSRLLRFHLFRAEGEDAEEAAKRAGITPRAAPYFLQRARNHRLDRLIARHHHFVEAEESFKKGRSTPRQALERLLVALLTPA